jgi:hypothetical protein
MGRPKRDKAEKKFLGNSRNGGDMRKLALLLVVTVLMARSTLFFEEENYLASAMGQMFTNKIDVDSASPTNDPDDSIFSKDNINHQDVVFIFLVDESGSIVGTNDAINKCESREPIHKQNLKILFDILWELPAEDTQHIHIGIYRFGQNDLPIFPIKPFSEIDKKKVRNYFKTLPADTTTNYAQAITHAIIDLNKYAAARNAAKVLFILTDAFDVSKERDGVEKALLNTDLSTKIFISLACPGELGKTSKPDFDFWGMHRIPQANFPDDFFNAFLDNADMKTWKDPHGIVNNANSTVSIPGDAYRFQVIYYPFPGNGGESVFLYDLVDTEKAKYFSQSLYPVKPNSNCKNRDMALIGDDSFGFWQIRSSLLQLSIPNLVLEKIINFAPTLTKVKIMPSENQIARDDFRSWAGCYLDIGFEYSFNESGFDESTLVKYPNLVPIPCDNTAGFLCPSNDDALTKSWNWILVPDMDQNEVYLRPYVITTSGKIVGKKMKATLFYRPVLVDYEIPNISIPAANNGLGDVTTLVIRTIYNQTNPHFFLVRPVDFVVPKGLQCPQSKNGKDGSYIEVKNQTTYYRIISQKEVAPRSFKYEFNLSESVYEYCGFDTLVIQWDETGNQLPSIWECQYVAELNSWSCGEKH